MSGVNIAPRRLYGYCGGCTAQHVVAVVPGLLHTAYRNAVTYVRLCVGRLRKAADIDGVYHVPDVVLRLSRASPSCRFVPTRIRQEKVLLLFSVQLLQGRCTRHTRPRHA